MSAVSTENYKVGDRVVYVENGVTDGIVGRVSDYGVDPRFPYEVQWSNGCENAHSASELRSVIRPF